MEILQHRMLNCNSISSVANSLWWSMPIPQPPDDNYEVDGQTLSFRRGRSSIPHEVWVARTDTVNYNFVCRYVHLQGVIHQMCEIIVLFHSIANHTNSVLSELKLHQAYGILRTDFPFTFEIWCEKYYHQSHFLISRKASPSSLGRTPFRCNSC